MNQKPTIIEFGTLRVGEEFKFSVLGNVWIKTEPKRKPDTIAGPAVLNIRSKDDPKTKGGLPYNHQVYRNE